MLCKKCHAGTDALYDSVRVTGDRLIVCLSGQDRGEAGLREHQISIRADRKLVLEGGFANGTARRGPVVAVVVGPTGRSVVAVVAVVVAVVVLPLPLCLTGEFVSACGGGGRLQGSLPDVMSASGGQIDDVFVVTRADSEPTMTVAAT